MIKEFKVNLFRAFRTKSFYVILGVFLALSLLSSFVIFFVSEDPFSFFSMLEEQLDQQYGPITEITGEDYDPLYDEPVDPVTSSETEFSDESLNSFESELMERLESKSEAGIPLDQDDFDAMMTYGDEYFGSSSSDAASSVLLALGMNDYYVSSINTPSGVFNVMWGNETAVFLFCIFVALFTGMEYKMRYHVIHFSGNSSTIQILSGEWLTLSFLIFVVQAFFFLFTLGLTCLFCPSFRWEGLGDFLARAALIYLLTVAFATFAFMIAVLRRGAAMSIVLSSLLAFGVVNFLFLLASILKDTIINFSLNFILEYLTSTGDISAKSYLAMFSIVFAYIVVFMGITLVVSSHRDAY